MRIMFSAMSSIDLPTFVKLTNFTEGHGAGLNHLYSLVLILDDGMLKYESADVSVAVATDQFAAIINPPQSGILAVGAAAEQLMVHWPPNG